MLSPLAEWLSVLFFRAALLWVPVKRHEIRSITILTH